MKTMRMLILMVVSGCPLAAQTLTPSRPADEVIHLWKEGGWKGELPDGWQIEGPEKSEHTGHMGGTLAVKNVSEPQLEYFKAIGEVTPLAVIVCPGGGYNILAWDLEGTEIATWLSSNGMHAFVLKYRLPRGDDVRHAAALQDAQRSISLVRSAASVRGISPDKIGIMGFSAGAHLSALAATNHARRTYAAKDEIDAASCRPDFVGLIYSAYLLKDAKDPSSGIAPQLPVGPDTPPAFLVHTMDDPLPCANATAWVLAMQKLKIPAELHIYAEGGHGYGLRSDKSVKSWPGDMITWLKAGAGRPGK